MSTIKPLYLLAGGRPRDPQAMLAAIKAILAECGTVRPRIAYLGAANGDQVGFFQSIKSMLQEAGAGEVFLLQLARPKIDLAAVKQALENADAVFISGGEVEDGMRWLQRHQLIDFLAQLRQGGKLFFGMSAGSIMMGSAWVRWQDPADDSTAALFDCLGFVPTVFDTHAEDEDWVELKKVLQLQGEGACGYGIPSGSLLRVDAEGKMTTYGSPLLCYLNHAGQVQRK
ncbi:MAG: Type 1 glutamine amidotransferase-like domain-containing protein [Negativicutes bacterium]|nr:Type 1 glutamine amidotransferase-like domain-containing protein [Negativicutes bacterium]